jgi:Holliday junction resolvase-like predicted endonuclease
VTEDLLQILTLLDKLKLYPDIVLDETIASSKTTLQDLLARANSPGSNDDAGLILEELAKVFLESPYLKLNKERRRCENGEIDLDFAVKRFEATLFYEFSYLLIVECKNWSKKAGAPEIRVFCSKMRDVRSNVGILFSKNGITKDARRIVRDAWLRDEIVVIVLDFVDLDGVINGPYNLYEIIKRKYLAVRTASAD